MANTKDFFLTISERVLSNWTALKLTVDHGMGSREDAIDFASYITDIFYMNEDLENDEIEEVAAEIEEYMNEVFQTELQDNSAAEVAKELHRFHKYCLEGDKSTALIELEKLPPAQPWLTGRRPAKQEHSQSHQPELNVNKSDDVDVQMEEDDGWTEVKTRKHK